MVSEPSGLLTCFVRFRASTTMSRAIGILIGIAGWAGDAVRTGGRRR